MPRAGRKAGGSKRQEAARENHSRRVALFDPEVISDLADMVPATDGELEVIETYLGALIDGLLGDAKRERQAVRSHGSHGARGRRRRVGADKG